MQIRLGDCGKGAARQEASKGKKVRRGPSTVRRRCDDGATTARGVRKHITGRMHFHVAAAANRMEEK